MNDDFYLNDVEDVSDFLKSVYEKEYPELVITPRITQYLFKAIIDDFKGEDAHLEPYNTELIDFLKGERFISFIQTRQPDVSRVPDNVIDDVIDFFKNELSGFTPLKVCRHSNHPDDSYLYSVFGQKEDGSIACWSTFNESTKSMNYGHYGLSSFEDAMDVIKDNFHDITEDMEHFGPESSLTEIPKEKLENTEDNSASVIQFRHRSR